MTCPGQSRRVLIGKNRQSFFFLDQNGFDQRLGFGIGQPGERCFEPIDGGAMIFFQLRQQKGKGDEIDLWVYHAGYGSMGSKCLPWRVNQTAAARPAANS